MARAKKITKAGKLIGYQAVARIDGKDKFGTRHKLYRDALDAAAKMEADAKAGIKAPKFTGVTLTDYAAEHLSTRSMSDQYRMQLEHRNTLVVRVAGDLKLRNLDVATSRRVAYGLGQLHNTRGKPYSPTVVAQAWQHYVRLVKTAAEDGLAPAHVIPQRVELPVRPGKNEKLYLAPEVKAALIAAVWTLTPFYGPMMDVLFASGMRIGEAIALRREDFNPFTRTIMVARTLTRRGGKSVIGDSTKTHVSREVKLDDATCKTLRAHLDSHESEWAFPASNGHWLSYDWYRRKVWEPACKQVGITVGARITRHQHCSELLMAGVPSAIIIRRTGHSSTAMLDLVYGHVLVEADETALSRLADWQAKTSERTLGGAHEAGQ